MTTSRKPKSPLQQAITASIEAANGDPRRARDLLKQELMSNIAAYREAFEPFLATKALEVVERDAAEKRKPRAD